MKEGLKKMHPSALFGHNRSVCCFLAHSIQKFLKSSFSLTLVPKLVSGQHQILTGARLFLVFIKLLSIITVCCRRSCAFDYRWWPDLNGSVHGLSFYNLNKAEFWNPSAPKGVVYGLAPSVYWGPHWSSLGPPSPPRSPSPACLTLEGLKGGVCNLYSMCLK